ncbi:MAG: hypothetical protein E3K37_15190 [Candidatus Kuenenia sp.]|nr:hypothetical protein [Candidatus Kuenenia hertensis]
MNKFLNSNFFSLTRLLKTKIIVPAGLLIFVMVLSANCALQKKVDSKEAHEVKETEPTSTKTVQTENATWEKVESSGETVPTNEKNALEDVEKELSESLTGFDEALSKKLEEAREKLLESQKREKQIAAELERLRNTGNVSSETLEKYEADLNQARAEVHEIQKELNEIKSAGSKYLQTKGTVTGTSAVSTKQEGKGIGSSAEGVPAGAAQDELGNLIKELDQSLTEFDALLLKEMNELREKKQGKISGMAEDGTAASQDTGGKGTGAVAGGSPGKASTGGDAQKGKTAEPSEGGEVSYGEGYGTVSGGGSPGEWTGTESTSVSGTRGGRPPYGSTQDDDVVARQIREAAEKETDPVLKEKLWKEYEEYKKGTSGNE